MRKVECGQYPVPGYCGQDKVGRTAHGFRDGQERIAFPLDTLFNLNAIVASALHLAMINTVPILQTAGERKDLELRCRGRCDIIFSYQRTLGTYEHRMFLETAHAYQDQYMFAITTYTAGTLGLSPTAKDQEVGHSLWVVHCADKTPEEECVVSSYRRKMVLSQLHEIRLSPGSREVATPYDHTEMPWILLLHDSASRSRVMTLVPHLAQLLHGTAATLTFDLEQEGVEVLADLGLSASNIVAPALAILQPPHLRKPTATVPLLNDYDDPLEWLNDQLDDLQIQPVLSKEEQGTYLSPLPFSYPEVRTSLIPFSYPEVRTSLPYLSLTLRPATDHRLFHSRVATGRRRTGARNGDPVSNILLQHLDSIVPQLHELGSHASLYRVNCFDWPKVCDANGISTYPVLRLHPKGANNITYDGAISGAGILKAILLCEGSTPLEVTSGEVLEELLRLSPSLHPALALPSPPAVAVGVFATLRDAAGVTQAAAILRGTHLVARHISPAATSSMCGSRAGCVVVAKPHDRYQPRRILRDHLNDPSAIANVLRYATLPVMSGGAKADDLAPDQYHVILFLPAASSEFPSGGREPRDAALDAVGQVAAEVAGPDLTFSWLSMDISRSYGLDERSRVLVAVNLHAKTVTVYPHADLAPSSLLPWLQEVRATLSSILLPARPSSLVYTCPYPFAPHSVSPGAEYKCSKAKTYCFRRDCLHV
ncbi:putative thioredoxin domain-containing protein 16-like isoform X1 [Penaeus vannamei]|uniref:Putative thioredoxin domain-containing protein 16-like isoform X1 n=1 Tax=Penaeus vannamei TaxID=6689 RepID=A0A423SQI4_PENVA|nr:putative thioredoxin domain-containing protein 16-like isoform X1 [Penaeus vannamei]